MIDLFYLMRRCVFYDGISSLRCQINFQLTKSVWMVVSEAYGTRQLIIQLISV